MIGQGDQIGRRVFWNRQKLKNTVNYTKYMILGRKKRNEKKNRWTLSRKDTEFEENRFRFPGQGWVSSLSRKDRSRSKVEVPETKWCRLRVSDTTTDCVTTMLLLRVVSLSIISPHQYRESLGSIYSKTGTLLVLDRSIILRVEKFPIFGPTILLRRPLLTFS